MNITHLLDLNTFATICAFISSGFAGVQAYHAKNQSAETHAQTIPNHGSSLRDKVDMMYDMVKAQGHQIGQIKQDADFTHRQLADEIRNFAECQKNKNP